MAKHRIFSRLACSLMALGLANCGFLTASGDHPPVVAGELWSPGGSHPLSRRQVAALNAWLSEHRSGWSVILATPPVPDLAVVIQREDGKSARLEFYPQQGWKGALTYFGSESKENSQASFTAEQVLALRADLMAPQ